MTKLMIRSKKITSPRQKVRSRNSEASSGRVRQHVLIFGVFDLLHPGHIAFIRAAAKHGEVIAVVTPDAKVLAEKGRPAFFDENARLAMVAALKGVDHAELGDKGARWTVVARLAPDVICIGHDQDATHPKFLAQVAGLHKPPKIVRVAGYEVGTYSSSRLKLEIHRTERKKPPPAVR